MLIKSYEMLRELLGLGLSEEEIFELFDLEVKEVSLVDMPAIRRQFLMCKRDASNAQEDIRVRLDTALRYVAAGRMLLAETDSELLQQQVKDVVEGRMSDFSERPNANAKANNAQNKPLLFLRQAEELLTEIKDLFENNPSGVVPPDTEEPNQGEVKSNETIPTNKKGETMAKKYNPKQREDGVWVVSKDIEMSSAKEATLLSEIGERIESLMSCDLAVPENIEFAKHIQSLLSELVNKANKTETQPVEAEPEPAPLSDTNTAVDYSKKTHSPQCDEPKACPVMFEADELLLQQMLEALRVSNSFFS